MIRADAGTDIGSGHVMRCLALAETWQDSGGDVTFIAASSLQPLDQRLKSEGMGICYISSAKGSLGDARETVEVAKSLSAEWIVIDGYHFSAEYQKYIKDNGYQLLAVDDYGHAGHYYADIVLNQNSYANMTLYPSHESKTRFMLGTPYSLLRREFLLCSDIKRAIPEIAHNILVTFGGADPDNVTLSVIQILMQIKIEDLDIIVIAGSMNPHLAELKEVIRGHASFSIQTDVNNMPGLMAWADLAIAAGGSTCWELAFMGVPSILYPFAENQKPNVKDLKSKGAIKSFIHPINRNSKRNAEVINQLLLSEKRRTILHQRMKNLVDGYGSRRVILAMSKAEVLTLRPAEPGDCSIFWRWANDPVVRESSFHPEQIPWSEHKRWFFGKIRDPNCFIFIMENDQGLKIGQIRFDIVNGMLLVDVSIDKFLRGLGFGSRLIRAGIDKIQKIAGILQIHAYIKTNNISSIRSFENADFSIAGDINISGHHVYDMRWEKR